MQNNLLVILVIPGLTASATRKRHKIAVASVGLSA